MLFWKNEVQKFPVPVLANRIINENYERGKTGRGCYSIFGLFVFISGWVARLAHEILFKGLGYYLECLLARASVNYNLPVNQFVACLYGLAYHAEFFK